MSDPFTLALFALVSVAGPLVYVLLLLSKPTSAVRQALVPAPLRPILKQYNRLSVLLITAHPDDECMFFAPTVIQLAAGGAEVGVLCLSQGNADGLGSTRRKELVESCKALGVHASRVTCLDHPDLQDNPKLWWKAEVVAEAIRAHVAERKVDVIITFDLGGVSGHSNHKALYEGVRYFMNLPSPPSKSPTPTPTCYALNTVMIVRKYLSVLDIGQTAAHARQVGYEAP
ncbi:hypothetical protein PhCBS80983_g02689 [Powellomyces hirtus]|uniref:N-acetylglucosaminylphosphatidylinositol deacetylase n=1 Tax=Powellomyces hirtus TaxID=109895 RepID=A0A507E7K2_9FUNG|nr:hypothetical protein PhCBS80983_g02689 [Powellomyces hirtus]